MLADHIAKSFSLKGASFFLLSDLIGRITFPVFCMLLAEGFFHTGSRSRYILRLLLLALLSEIPYDLALHRQICDWSSQNTCFTLLLGLLMFSLLEMIRSKQKLHYRISGILQITAVLFFAAAAYWLHADYQANGIAALVVFYFSCKEAENRSLSPKKRGAAAAAACLCLNIWQFYNAGAFLSIIPLSLYNGQRGAISRTGKYAFYLFYPLHLLVIVLLHIM